MSETLSETYSEGQQASQVDENEHYSDLSVESYLTNELQEVKSEDTLGIERPVFSIGDRDVVFRTRQQQVEYSGKDVYLPGNDSIKPIVFEFDQKNQDRMASLSSVGRYVEANQEDGPNKTMVVTNTPEGILQAASELTKDEAVATEYREMIDSLEKGKVSEKELLVMDVILASVLVGDDMGIDKAFPGSSKMHNMKGFAVALAALSGDEKAKAILEPRVEALVGHDRSRLLEVMSRDSIEHEAVPLDKLALVHTTKYDIERNDTGDVVLSSLGNKRDDRFPRASLHFTLNSRVASHAMAPESWGVSDTMIVANAKKAIEASKRLPESLNVVDSWFMLNPGENLTLPDAVLVKPDTNNEGAYEDGAVIANTDGEVNFIEKPDYTPAEEEWLKKEAGSLGLGDYDGVVDSNFVKEIALRKAMLSVGVPSELMDLPSHDGTEASSSRLSAMVGSATNGLPASPKSHYLTPEARLEQGVASSFNSSALEASSGGVNDNVIVHGLPLEAKRQALYGGYYPVPSRDSRGGLQSDMEDY